MLAASYAMELCAPTSYGAEDMMKYLSGQGVARLSNGYVRARLWSKEHWLRFLATQTKAVESLSSL